MIIIIVDRLSKGKFMESELVSAIQALSSSNKARKSKVGRIRELLPYIESAQRAGVRLTDIAEALRNHGIEGVDLKGLQNLLYQARKRINRKVSIDVKPRNLAAPDRCNTNSAGIDAESIFAVARKSMKSNHASGITLGLLRSTNLTSERK